MFRNRVYLWCRYAKSHNPLSQQQCPSVDSCCRFQNSVRMSGMRSRAKSPNELDCVTLPSSSLVKPALFTVLVSTASFTGAAIWQYENMRNRARELFRTPKKWIVERFRPSELWSQNKLNGKNQATFRLHLTEGQKTFAAILFVNTLVFIAWKIPRFEGIMMKYFASSSTSRNVCIPMLLSCFSHSSGLHLGVNMYVLYSFISSIVDVLGKEQFLAVYLTSGVIAAFASQAFRILSKQASLSLGASGCIMGIISYTCFKYPDTKLSIILLPMITFDAGTAIQLLMCADLLCLVLKFKLFDHAAHLGGAIFGLFWYAWGNQNIWQRRGPLLEWWHSVRTAKK